MKNILKAAVAIFLVAGVYSAQAQTTTTTTTKKTTTKKTAPESEVEKQIREMRKEFQEQIDLLKQQIAARDSQIQAAQDSAAAAQHQAAVAVSRADTVSSSESMNSTAVSNLQTSVDSLKTSSTAVADSVNTVVEGQKKLQSAIESPTAIHYKGVTVTPVAFFAAEDVWRERAVNSDINTPFNSIPFPSANEGHVSEFNFSGRQSRVGALFQGDAGSFKLSGYVEADFLGTGTTSNNNQSNSYVLRQRQIWGQAAMNSGFTLTGGQMWSLVTEDGKSTDPRTEKLPNAIDAQYTVGFSWERQPGLRLQQRFGDVKTSALTLAMSLEQAQITNFTAATGSGSVPADFFFAGVGQGGGLYNAAANYSVTGASAGIITTYANNVAPDVVVKAAFDLPMLHAEVGGLARFLRDYYFPVTGVTGSASSPVYSYASTYVSHTSPAGGAFGSIRVSAGKFADIGVSAMAGTGVGRYGSSQLADATLRPNETLEPIRDYHGLFTLETHPTPKLDVYAYYGGEYAQRTVYVNSVGTIFGYGTQNLNNAGCYNLPSPGGNSGTGGTISASTCGSPTRYIQEGLLGFTYRFVNSPKYGRLQYAVNYQNIQRNLWSGLGSASTPTGPRALDNMIFTSMRYYIP